MNEPETITIPRSLYEDLMESHTWLVCLESAGVDNWDGISYAHDLMELGED